MKTVLGLTVVLAAAVGFAEMELSAPEAQGVSARAVLRWLDTVDRLDAMHSYVLVRHGKVVSEGWWKPYKRDVPQHVYSLSKSFTSTAIGMAEAEGKLKLDQRVVSFFPADKLPEKPDENLLRMRVRDLLCMGTGHRHDTMGAMYGAPDGDWVRGFFSQPVQFDPGTHFCYNTGATYMLSEILTRVTGEDTFDYLQKRLFKPMGIENTRWTKSPLGVSVGGYGLCLCTRDAAKFGQLYLQRGVWEGKQLVPSDWTVLAGSKQISNGNNPNSDWGPGYGFQFWRCQHNAFRGDGAFGQECIIMPDQDVVLAVTAGMDDISKIFNSVWRILLPEMRDTALPADPAADEELSKRSASLTIRPVEGASQSETQPAVMVKKFELGPNRPKYKSMALRTAEQGWTLEIDTPFGLQKLNIGHGCWVDGEIQLEPDNPRDRDTYPCGKQLYAASGAWTDGNRFRTRVFFIAHPGSATFDLVFSPQGTLKADLNYRHIFGFGHTEFLGQ